jgi:hypothetical protein
MFSLQLVLLVFIIIVLFLHLSFVLSISIDDLSTPLQFIQRNKHVHPNLKTTTNVSSISNGNLRCKMPKTCEFFKNTLLVIKLNPVRLLWLDTLLRFYSLGFQNIVFFAPLEKKDSVDQNRKMEYLRVGEYDTPVHLVDDNYGFCDHETIAKSMQLYGNDLDGFFFLSDDVLMQFWRFAGGGFDLSKYWRQQPTRGKIQRTPNHDAAWDDVIALFPDLKSTLPASRDAAPFASTSGIYFVPTPRGSVVGDEDKRRFIAISGILNRHRTYNEWGTPFLLECVSRGAFQVLRGKLVWGTKRHFVTRIPQLKNLWFHPVRAGSELFARVEALVNARLGDEADAGRRIPELDHSNVFSAEFCFDCATYPLEQRNMKSLLHSCVLVKNPDVEDDEGGSFFVDTCNQKPSQQQQVEAIKKLWPIMGGENVAKFLTGPTFRVRKNRDKIPNAFELNHEGFWNEKVVREVFYETYPKFYWKGEGEGEDSKKKMSSPFWKSYPECCVFN